MTPAASPSPLHVQARLFKSMVLAKRFLAAGETPPVELMRELAAARELAEARPAPPWFERLGLTQIEGQLLWAFAVLASDEQAATIFGCGPGEVRAEAITSVVAGIDQPGMRLRCFGAAGALRRLCLIERSDGGGAEVHESRWTWSISDRALALVHGENSVDDALAGIARRSDAVPPLASLAVAPGVVAGARDAMCAGKVIVSCSGMPGTGRRTVLVASARECGRDVLVIDAKRLGADRLALSKQLRIIARDCRLLDLIPLFAHADALGDRIDEIGTALLPELDGPILITTGQQRPAMRWGRPLIALDMPPPSSEQRARLWHVALGQGTEEDGQRLATQFPLAPAVIHDAAIAAKARAGDRNLTPDDIYAGVRAVLDDRLGDFARRVSVTQTWDDLVLPQDQLAQLAGLIARVRQRRRVFEEWGFAAKVGKGLGIAALFSGPPGTGKTMVAALVARELGLELYQVDMARLVSKYVGETEKQLAAMFDAAEAGQAVVLFDEADSLFGKRTEVRSSNDRYANLETNYLLQRLESFTGICLLTSNHEANIDPAFQRRLSLHVRFELPDITERTKLWRAMLPAAAPVAEQVDVGSLARRYAMSGGYIRNAVLSAAFLAADEGAEISQSHLEYAAALEYEGMGKIVTRAA